jgi:hypothetical protein
LSSLRNPFAFFGAIALFSVLSSATVLSLGSSTWFRKTGIRLTLALFRDCEFAALVRAIGRAYSMRRRHG